MQIAFSVAEAANNHVIVHHVVRCCLSKTKSNPTSGLYSHVVKHAVSLISKLPQHKELVVVIGMSKRWRSCGKE